MRRSRLPSRHARRALRACRAPRARRPARRAKGHPLSASRRHRHRRARRRRRAGRLVRRTPHAAGAAGAGRAADDRGRGGHAGHRELQAHLGNELRDKEAKITLLEARLAESQSQQAALEALYRDLAPSRDEIALTEIEQVLLVASQQLQLAGNVPSALAALQLADARLQRLERPQFLPLRRALTRDMDRLKAMPFVDVAGMSLKLDQALAAVSALPLAMDERLPPPAPAKAPAAAAEEAAWQRLLREAWAEIRQLVRIEVADRPAAPLLIPSRSISPGEPQAAVVVCPQRAAVSRRCELQVRRPPRNVAAVYDTRAKAVQECSPR
jgi:hypothetical protein